jgi:hypothetical protein
MLAKRATRFFGGLCAVLLCSLALAGCGSSNGRNNVSGTVTQGGQPVAGVVTFIDGANKEYASPISAEGKYQVLNLPTGLMKITVKLPPTVAASNTRGSKAPEMPTPTVTKGATPNPKYARADNGLTFTVSGGDQDYNIDLK